MTTLTLERTRAPEALPIKDNFVPPAYALRDMPGVSELPKDELGREIAVLLHEHQGRLGAFVGTDLIKMSQAEKVALLSDLKVALEIRPVARRRLGYVGP